MTHNIFFETMKLKDLAMIRSGLVLARKESKQKTKHTYALLNLKSIHPMGYIETNKLDVFWANDALNDVYLTQPGDVVVRLSIPYTAVCIDTSTQNLVVPSNFVVIRTDPHRLLPKFLFWYLNRAPIKRQIYENTTSNVLAAIKPSFFMELQIPDMDVCTQNCIAESYETAQKEIRLLHALAEAKEKYYEAVLDGALRGVPARG